MKQIDNQTWDRFVDWLSEGIDLMSDEEVQHELNDLGIDTDESFKKVKAAIAKRKQEEEKLEKWNVPLHKCCSHMARTYEETNGGRFPPSEHHPACPNFVLEEFDLLENEGNRCVSEPGDLDDQVEIINEEYGGNVKIQKVMLTRDQFERLGDFPGW